MVVTIVMAMVVAVIVIVTVVVEEGVRRVDVSEATVADVASGVRWQGTRTRGTSGHAPALRGQRLSPPRHHWRGGERVVESALEVRMRQLESERKSAE